MAEIFRRVEKKYIVNELQYHRIKEKLSKYMNEDKYGKSTICNIYFDTDDYELISHSITKPYFKEKIRLRSYNIPNKDSKVFLEIKRKYDGVVGKRRIEMKLSDFEQYLQDKNSIKSNNKQIKSELDYYFKIYNLKPAMYISYSREAYYEKDNSDFRLTFDSNVLARDFDLKLDKGVYGKDVLGSGKYIMEVKTLGALPMWFVDILNETNVTPGSFSKYGTAYTEFILKPAIERREAILNSFIFDSKTKNNYALKQCAV
ncbi:MAG: polyphosphate polymerase domain-containing protein [Clostridia bacterium]|nr:polyphosphate polymerase domain-containing protein [Clostridia bacterium]